MGNNTNHIKLNNLLIVLGLLYIINCEISLACNLNVKLYSENDSLQYIPNDNEYNIMIAASKGDYVIVEKLLHKGVSANIVLEDGTTPIIIAAQTGHLNICNLLFANGANINFQPHIGNTALIAAVKGKQPHVVDFLIEKGAEINLTDDLGRTAFMYAVATGDSAMCEKLLAYNVDINLCDYNGANALMASVINQQKEMILYLLNKGANPNTTNSNGTSSLMIATQKGDYSTIELLLNHGANINNKNKSKQTALTIAIEKNDEVLLQFLINKGADVNQRLSLAETPLTIAKYYRRDNFIIETLESKGAKQNHIPDFRRVTIGAETVWNFDDFMAGINFGIKEYKYKFDISTGIVFRPLATRILLYDSANIYYQYWERRNFAYIGLNKNFTLSRPNKKIKKEITFGVKELYNFGSYRGTSLKIDKHFLFVPEAGFLFYLRKMQFGAVYQYIKYDISTGISTHIINISAKIILGGNAKSNLYKPWDL